MGKHRAQDRRHGLCVGFGRIVTFTNAQQLYTIHVFTKRIGTSFFEATMRPNPTCVKPWMRPCAAGSLALMSSSPEPIICAVPGVRYCRFRNRGTEYVSVSGIKWMKAIPCSAGHDVEQALEGEGRPAAGRRASCTAAPDRLASHTNFARASSRRPLRHTLAKSIAQAHTTPNPFKRARRTRAAAADPRAAS